MRVDATRVLVGIELHPFHFIVEESLEYLIEEVLAGRATQAQCRPIDASWPAPTMETADSAQS